MVGRIKEGRASPLDRGDIPKSREETSSPIPQKNDSTIPDAPYSENPLKRRNTAPVPEQRQGGGVNIAGGPRRPSSVPTSINSAGVIDISAQTSRAHKLGTSPKERAMKALVQLQIGVKRAPPSRAKTMAQLRQLQQLAAYTALSIQSGAWNEADVGEFCRLVHDGIARHERHYSGSPNAPGYQQYFVEVLAQTNLPENIKKLF